MWGFWRPCQSEWTSVNAFRQPCNFLIVSDRRGKDICTICPPLSLLHFCNPWFCRSLINNIQMTHRGEACFILSGDPLVALTLVNCFLGDKSEWMKRPRKFIGCFVVGLYSSWASTHNEASHLYSDKDMEIWCLAIHSFILSVVDALQTSWGIV